MFVDSVKIAKTKVNGGSFDSENWCELLTVSDKIYKEATVIGVLFFFFLFLKQIYS